MDVGAQLSRKFHTPNEVFPRNSPLTRTLSPREREQLKDPGSSCGHLDSYGGCAYDFFRASGGMAGCDRVRPCPLVLVWGYSSIGRARRSQCRGWGFDPPYLHQPAPVAQRIERRRPKSCVGGSSPSRGTIFRLQHSSPRAFFCAGTINQRLSPSQRRGQD